MKHYRGRVLVAEDDQVTARVLRTTLQKLGVTVDVVRNGREAVEAALNGRYDLVLMDVRMPCIDGLEAVHLIRQWETRAGDRPVRIVALTASGAAADRARCLDAGMDDCLVKPIKPHELEGLLERWIGDSAGLDAEMLDEIGTVLGTSLLDVTEAYRESYRTLTAGMGEALRARDATALCRHAHALKSSSGHLGIRDVYRLAKEIEDAAKRGSLNEAALLLWELESRHMIIESNLLTYLEGRFSRGADQRPTLN